MTERDEFIYKIAKELVANGLTMSVHQLVAVLNAAGKTTDAGEPHRYGAQGPYKVARTVYDRVLQELGPDEASKVAIAFTKPDGSLAWEDAEVA